MKKIISLIICTFVLIGTFGVAATDDNLKIVSGSILNGELDAPVSVLLRYEFSEEIKEPSEEDITFNTAVISSIEVSGNVLTIRLSAKMAYNTKYTLDLSKITSVSGKKLSEADSLIKFETKFGAADNNFDDDFETGVLDTAVWRSATDVIVQKDGDGGNHSRKAAGSSAFDNFIGSSAAYRLDGDFTVEFDIFIDKDTIEADYITFLMAGNNGKSSNDPERKVFETKRLLGYDKETGVFGVMFDTVDTSASFPSAPVAGNVLLDGWNNIFLKFTRETQSLCMYINEELVKDKSGKSEFLFPCVGSTGYSPIGDISVTNIRHQNAGSTNYSGGADAEIYYDNISYGEIAAPRLASSSIENDEVISTARPKIDIAFKNFPEIVELFINEEKISESEIFKSGNVFTIYPDLQWETEYVVSGKAVERFGKATEFELKFKTAAMPDKLIEAAGFFGKGGERIVSLESGNISAKVNFWQKKSESYVLIAACYKEINGRIKMVSISSPQIFTSENELEEKTVTVAVPEDKEGCFVEYIVLKDTLEKMPCELSLYSGKNVLK